MDFCPLENYNKEKSSQCNFTFYRSFFVEKIMWPFVFPLLKDFLKKKELIGCFYLFITLDSSLIL